MTEYWGGIFKILYILLSLKLIFLPLVSSIPPLMKKVPFYRRASLAINLICDRKKEITEEFILSSDKSKVNLAVSYIKRGEVGFNELLQVITANEKFELKEVKRICLSWGNIPIRTPLMYSPNCVLFIADNETGGDGTAEIVIFNEFRPLHPDDVRKILLGWLHSKVQTNLAMYTVIVAVTWVAVMTLVIWG